MAAIDWYFVFVELIFSTSKYVRKYFSILIRKQQSLNVIFSINYAHKNGILDANVEESIHNNIFPFKGDTINQKLLQYLH